MWFAALWWICIIPCNEPTPRSLNSLTFPSQVRRVHESAWNTNMSRFIVQITATHIQTTTFSKRRFRILNTQITWHSTEQTSLSAGSAWTTGITVLFPFHWTGGVKLAGRCVGSLVTSYKMQRGRTFALATAAPRGRQMATAWNEVLGSWFLLYDLNEKRVSVTRNQMLRLLHAAAVN